MMKIVPVVCPWMFVYTLQLYKEVANLAGKNFAELAAQPGSNRVILSIFCGFSRVLRGSNDYFS